jgi:2-dehydropantoate 2-reductase
MLSVTNNIFIIGSGAIGKALAVFLKQAGRNVMVIRGSVNDSTTTTEQIRVEMPDGSIHQSDITISTLSTIPVLKGIVVLANKSFGNEQLAVSLKNKTGDSPIVLLQNGLGVERPFLNYQYTGIYRCVLYVTSQVINNTTVRFRPVSVCPVGIERGDPNQLSDIVEQLNTKNFGFRTEQNIQLFIWKKAIVNCVFNSVCPLLEVDNGIFHRNEEVLQMARRIISECIVIANAKGIVLHEDEVEASLLQISRLSDGQEISTLQDIRNKRRTEIETLNPEIVKIAKSLDKEDRVQETKLLGELTRLKADINFKKLNGG